MDIMMTAIFLYLINVSITAGWLILAVLVLRLLLKKAPKWICCMLWGLVGIKLLLPISIESVFSLIPSEEVVSEELLYASTPAIDSGIEAVNQVVNPMLQGSFTPGVGASVNPLQVVVFAASWGWLLGMVVLLIYTVATYVKIKRQVREAVRLRGNIYQSERVASPFILGAVKPCIYVPYGLGEKELCCVIAHEEAHISRRDHLWKPLAFLILAVYWFQPLVWVAYVLLCRDIEFACDEKVMQQIGTDKKKQYSEALLRCSVAQGASHKVIAACPVAFGEVGVKTRIKSVLHYKKPAFWVIVIALLACVVCALCFMTSPGETEQTAAVEETMEETTVPKEILQEPPVMNLYDPSLSVLNGELYGVYSGNYSWYYPGSESKDEMVAVQASGASPRQESMQNELLHWEGHIGVEAVLYVANYAIEPDRITLREYDLEDEDENVLSETVMEESFFFDLRRGRVYEVIAEWDEAHLEKNGFYGTARYAFATKSTSSESASEAEIQGVVSPPTMVLQDALSSTLNYYMVQSGTYNWNYQNGNSGEIVGAEASGRPPADAVKGQDWLPVVKYNRIDYSPYMVNFEATPDRITVKEYDSLDLGRGDEAEAVTIEAQVKEVMADREGYLVISSQTDEFPGAFLLKVPSQVYDISELQGGEMISATMRDTKLKENQLSIYEAMRLDIL